MAELYKYRNKKTGKITSFDWDGPKPPTPSDIRSIETRQEQDIVGRQAIRIAKQQRDAPKIRGMIGSILSAPSEYVAPSPMPQEEVEQLPITSRIGRLGRELASGILAPENLALAPLAAFPPAA